MPRFKARGPQYPAPTEAGTHYLVSVDLGKHKVGVALWGVAYTHNAYFGGLISAVTVDPGDVGPHVVAEKVLTDVYRPHITREGVPIYSTYWVCEWPMKYADKRLYHEDIEHLHATGDAIAKLVGGWDAKYRPGQWKGNVPKAPHHRRLARELSEEERAIAPPAKDHDAWDAIGIGLYALGRTQRGGVQWK